MSKEIIALKEQQVADIQSKIEKSKSVVLVDYRGLTVSQDTAMRNELRKANVEYKVLKNRLVLRAFNQAGFAGFDKVLEGPTAVAFGYEDAVSAAKIIVESATKTNNKISVKGGVVEGKILDGASMKLVANIPPKPILLAQLLGLLTSPMRSLAIACSEIAKKN